MDSKMDIGITPVKATPEPFIIYTSPEKIHPEEIINAAIEAIKRSNYAENPGRWHWAVMETVCDGTKVDAKSPEYLEAVKKSIHLADAVWYTSRVDADAERVLPQEKKHKPSAQSVKERVTNTQSISEMAQSGARFKLDWNSQNTNVFVYGGGEADKENLMARKRNRSMVDDDEDDIEEPTEYMIKSGDEHKENTRPIKQPRPVSCLRRRLHKASILSEQKKLKEEFA
ncbi:hypothetical protein ABW20_dc0107792 [Dactylellina cionopaga]|nr:hypothetical protein ABW20_dc0107792 [Dactylellina cionopaga]